MKKKYVAIIIGAMILISSSVSYAIGRNQLIADKVNFKILLDGSEFETVKPIVTIDGTTYLPLREIGNALNTKVIWNSGKRQVEIGEMGSYWEVP